MNAYVARLRGGPCHGQSVEIAQPALCLLLRVADGFAAYDLCAAADFTELVYRYSHTDRGEPFDEAGDPKE